VLLEIHAILAETLGEHAPSYATVKIWVAQFLNVVIFTPFFPGRAKELSAPRVHVLIDSSDIFNSSVVMVFPILEQSSSDSSIAHTDTRKKFTISFRLWPF
jgi:hypothetical protein